ncbi:MAG TPA: hypothetical protein VLG50_04610 [Candidatus Saccharimonadales bacterium]|nr:hypothetical protein [Candidatus Saccharimonadales bacterium]
MKKYIKNFLLFIALHISIMCYSLSLDTQSTPPVINRSYSTDSTPTQSFQNSQETSNSSLSILSDSFAERYTVTGVAMSVFSEPSEISQTPTLQILNQSPYQNVPQGYQTEGMRSVNPLNPFGNPTAPQNTAPDTAGSTNSIQQKNCTDYCICVDNKATACCQLSLGCFLFPFLYTLQCLKGNCCSPVWEIHKDNFKSDCAELCCDCDRSYANHKRFIIDLFGFF